MECRKSLLWSIDGLHNSQWSCGSRLLNSSKTGFLVLIVVDSMQLDNIDLKPGILIGYRLVIVQNMGDYSYMITPASTIYSNNCDGNNCSAAVISPLLSSVFVCLDKNTKCIHALDCGSTCYCANHKFYQKNL